ncbi:hypothetical protein UK15_37165 [Streptomyces variegatus]|uniref:Uncharacterized protein n=1 Tax=Streptomyces variegatus TaxID=284040 RepID=A0A0M2GGZ2_9ACTN|nr:MULTISPECIES: hypothetical protein [Streptomyces]KJK34168.1 hypothetical protein UK15_37165 [Streptomyces variegatus]
MPDTHPRTHMTTALALRATARAVVGHRRRAWCWLGTGITAVVVGLAVGPGADEASIGWLRALAVFCVGCGPVAGAVGVAALVNSRRIRRAVAAHAWMACSAVAIPPSQGPPRVVLRHPADGTLIPLSARTVAPRYHLANPEPRGVLWWAGDPRTGGVIAPPGGKHLVRVRPTRSDHVRRRDVEAAVRHGLLARPAPPQPHLTVLESADQAHELDLSYAELAEAARRFSRPGTDGHLARNGPDVRAVPWWRVRVLLEISKVRPAAVSAAFAAVMLLLWWLWARDLQNYIPLLAGILSAGYALRFGLLALRAVPVVKALHRAARAPAPVPKRYVLLPGFDDGLVLVLFPAHGGPEDMPEASLEVNPPGDPKHPWQGMPPPVGTLELRGWWDSAPTVVPWIGGRPLWPRYPYERVNLDDHRERDYFAALLGRGQP